MNKDIFFLLGLSLIFILSCNKEDFNKEIEIPNFNFPKTVIFKDSLSLYNIFEGNSSDLVYSEEFTLLELSSILFTDHAYKQRLVKMPEGGMMTESEDGTIKFPNGTILTKTFFYYLDERDVNIGKRVIETRLEIKKDETWNMATYIWNESQTEATLELNGFDAEVNWINKFGINRSTIYHVPNENECITCHQSKSAVIPLGPTLRNLNREVIINGNSINQLSHFQNEGLLENVTIDQVGKMADYHDLNFTLEERGRSYLNMNCAHCHNPNSWQRAAEREFDFRYETPLDQAGILFETDKIINAIEDGEMPLIGTSILDDEGINLVIEYIQSL